MTIRTSSDDRFPVLPGAEAWSSPGGGPHGALVLHGFTGNPHSMRGVAEALAGAGLAVELPRLPGHGTDMDDMLPTAWADWSTAAEAGLSRLRQRLGDGGRVVVTGLSMGGTLTVWLATRHADLAGIACVNPLAEPPGPLADLVDEAIAAGTEVFPGIGSDIADPDAAEIAYGGTPLRALRTLLEAVEELQGGLDKVACPVLVMTSPDDHVVPPSNSDHLAARVSGPVERATLDRSYHVATLDYDKVVVEERIVEFALKAVSG